MDQPFTSLHFENREAWRIWLMENYSSEKEIWIRYFKKNSGKKSIIYREALKEALCFGWIDGIVRSIDEERYMQRFTPRRKGSNWSDTNIRLALELLSEGKMHESGLKFRDKWIQNPVGNVETKMAIAIPAEFEEALAQHPEASSNFSNLSPSCQKQYILWILDAKRLETRVKRIAESVALLEKGKKLGLK
jgi:uncharacterized protein YdeI (YjbR/CyaY-like superfamily)